VEIKNENMQSMKNINFKSCESKLTIPNNLSYLTMAINFVLENATIIGFEDKEIKDIHLAVEEAVSNVIEHAFLPEEDAEFTIICKRIPLGLKTIIREKGKPFDPMVIPKYEPNNPEEGVSKGGLGLYLMHQFMDDISFHILGRDGKEVHLTKYLHGSTIRESESLTKPYGNRISAQKESYAPKSIPFSVRMAKPSEAIEISKCAYDAYEYSYGHEHIYYPDRLKELIESGIIISAVAITKDESKSIMAHNALILDNPTDKIVEMGMAFTKQQYQNQGCSRKLGIYLLKEAVKRGIIGILLDCTTAHIYSQKAALGAGARECCILLGIDPQAQSWKHFSSQSQRTSNIIAYKKVPITSTLRQFKQKTILYIPEHHRIMIEKIYKNLNEKVKIDDQSTSELFLPQILSSIKVQTGKSYQQNATIEILSYGSDIIQQINKTVKRLCLDKFEVIYLLLNLEDPLTANMTKEFESLGFFFAGIIPCADSGDKLEFQYLNNVLIDYDRIQLYSDFAKELLDYIKERDPIYSNI
jgi:serine/threonine-protein kinase RsbW